MFLSDRVVVMSPRPGRIVATVPVELGSGGRDDALREDDAFFHAVASVRESLHGAPVPAAGRESR